MHRLRRRRLRFTAADRLLWTWLSQVWSGWRSAVHIVRPDTVAGIEALVEHVGNSFHLGAALGASGLAEAADDELLRRHLASSNVAQRQFVRGLVVGRGTVRGRDWIEAKADIGGLTPVQKADVLICLAGDSRTWGLARRDPEVDDAYWKEVRPIGRWAPDDTEYAARRLARAGRAFAAAQRLAFQLKDPSPPSAPLIADVLEAALRQDTVDYNSASASYWLGKLLDALANATDITEDRVAKLEWGFATALGHDRPLKTLHREISRTPTFFVDLLSLMYRAESEEPRVVTDVDKLRGEVAFRVLNSWKVFLRLPPTGPVGGPGLIAWVRTTLAEATARGRPTIGAQEIGKILSHSPHGTDGAWPHEAVRQVIEELANDDVDTGFRIAKYNLRGVVTRGVIAGVSRSASWPSSMRLGQELWRTRRRELQPSCAAWNNSTAMRAVGKMLRPTCARMGCGSAVRLPLERTLTNKGRVR